MQATIVLQLLEREIESELQIKDESDNQDIITQLIVCYNEVNDTYITNKLDHLINKVTLDSMIKIYSEDK
jgi:hypothetical protein